MSIALKFWLILNEIAVLFVFSDGIHDVLSDLYALHTLLARAPRALHSADSVRDETRGVLK